MTTETKTDATTNSEKQARAQLESIVEMVERWRHCQEFNDCPGHLDDCELPITGQERDEYHDLEGAEQRIQEDPLSIEVRSDWYTPGSDDSGKPTEYTILLCTGGPACRIIGDLGRWQEPETARIEHRDWFMPWQELVDISDEEQAALLIYAQHFYFGR